MRPVKIITKFLLIISLCNCNEENDDFIFENDILVLTASNFEKALSKYDYLFVMFYAPWCSYCKKFKPEFEKAANILSKENLIVGKIDGTIEKNLADKYDIKAYPTMKFFIKGSPFDYNGGRKESDVVNWVRKKSLPATRPLKTVEAYEKFRKENPLCIIYFGNDIEENKIFTNVAIKNEDYPFAYVEKNDIIEKVKEKRGTVVLFKNFDEKRNEIENFNEKNLNEFVETKTQKRVSNFDDKTTNIIFGKNHPTITYFGYKGKKWDAAEKLMEKIVDKAMEKNLKVTMSEIKEGMGKKIAEFIGLKKSELPTIRIIDTREKEVKKYIMEKEINEENIIEFISSWEKGKLKPHIKTQEEPKNNKGPIKELVGKSYKREVIDNDNDVMVVFYAPWCGQCKKLIIEYEKAAKKLKENNHKLILAKMDGTENEFEGLDVTSFPTIKFYPGNKKEKPKNYYGDRTAKGIIEFLKENCFHKLILDEEKSGEL